MDHLYGVAVRIMEPPEEIIFHAFRASCKYCGGEVVIRRNQALVLMPNFCHCLYCAQHYYIVVKNIRQWEHEQWMQKVNLTRRSVNNLLVEIYNWLGDHPYKSIIYFILPFLLFLFYYVGFFNTGFISLFRLFHR
jgi:hypothetical protein